MTVDKVQRWIYQKKLNANEKQKFELSNRKAYSSTNNDNAVKDFYKDTGNPR